MSYFIPGLVSSTFGKFIVVELRRALNRLTFCNNQTNHLSDRSKSDIIARSQHQIKLPENCAAPCFQF